MTYSLKTGQPPIVLSPCPGPVSAAAEVCAIVYRRQRSVKRTANALNVSARVVVRLLDAAGVTPYGARRSR
jgi:hypothetical protein